jgi:AcrR family transcriptional regulator
MKPIRDEQRDRTRERILEGAETVLRRGEALTFTRVAEAAEAPERTVYRHFETREALEAAIWGRVLERFANRELPSDVAAYAANVDEAFARFSTDPGLVRAILHSREVMHLRQIDDAPRRAALERCVRKARPDVSLSDARRAAAALRVLNSAPAWELLTDLWKLDAGEAAEVVKLAVRSLLDGLPASAPKPRKGTR